MESPHVDGVGVAEHRNREERKKRLVKMNDVELMLVQDRSRLSRPMERKGDAGNGARDGDGDGSPDNDQIGFIQLLHGLGRRGDDRDPVPVTHELMRESLDVIIHSPGMSPVVWRHQGYLQSKPPGGAL